MRKKSFVKRILAIVLSMVIVLSGFPLTSYADGTYTFPSRSQSGNNNSTLRYYLTDENAGDMIITEYNRIVSINLKLDDGWYFEKWDTYFNGYEDRPILSDPVVQGSNPVSDDGIYTFHNVNQYQPYLNVTYLYIQTGTILWRPPCYSSVETNCNG